MKLDEKRILQTAENVRNGIESKEVLIELLGGEKLDDVFDRMTKNALIKEVIHTGKIHSMLLGGSGIDVLEGLLNNQIVGNLSDFYMIKPTYIVSLSPEEQQNIAKSISDGREDLCIALQKLWSKGIMTEACTTKDVDNVPMIQLIVGEDNVEGISLLQQLYQQRDIQGSGFYYYDDNSFYLRLLGKNLYRYLQEGKTLLTTGKVDLFKIAVEESLEVCSEMYESYKSNEMDTTQLEAELIVLKKLLDRFSEKAKLLKDEIVTDTNVRTFDDD